MREALCRLSALEKERHASVDEPAAVFGDLLALIVSYGYEGDRATLAAHIGRTVGKFIYIADAADDYEKDVKSGSYNPFALLYKGGFTAEARTSAEVALRAEPFFCCRKRYARSRRKSFAIYSISECRQP